MKMSKTADHYSPRTVYLACGCKPKFKVSPPVVGDVLLCLRHGATVVVDQTTALRLRKGQTSGKMLRRQVSDAYGTSVPSR